MRDAKPSLIITGGGGFLARHVGRLVTDEFAVTFADSVDSSPDSNIDIVRCDVSEFGAVCSLFEKFKPEAVIHLAAITGVRRCQERPFESFLTNVVGTFNVAWACSAYDTRLIFASSREVYGETIGSETEEDSKLCPNNLYGLTKLLGESVIMWLADSVGMRYVVLRFTNLYGIGGDQYAVAALIKKALRDEEIPILGGAQVLNLINVKDAARAVQLCLQKRELRKAVFNIGSEDAITIQDLIKRIITLTGSKSKTRISAMRTGDTRFFNPSLAKARRELGFTTNVNLGAGLEECVEYYRMQLDAQ
jgi:nucleoside-diphosphate-sugar epimerase